MEQTCVRVHLEVAMNFRISAWWGSMRPRKFVGWIGEQVIDSCHRRDEVAEAFTIDKFQKVPGGWSKAFWRFLLDLTIIEARDDVRLINVRNFIRDRI
jgi:hypothetical protein